VNSRQETAGERFAADLAARYSSGRATRSAVDIENLLVFCRQCEKFTGDGCKTYDGSTPMFLTVLCDIRRHCENWPTPEEAS